MRYSAYVAGAILAFFVAVGVGAAAAVLVGWQFGPATTGPSGTTTRESSGLETTGTAKASEDTAIESSSGSDDHKDPNNHDRRINETSFVHRATENNSRGDFTYISDASIDGNANAVVLVRLGKERDGDEATSYGHNIGVWYEGEARLWAIFNQDLAPVPAGTTFKVVVSQASEGFVHRATPSNTVGDATYLNDPLTNGEPDSAVRATQNWNPGGGGGIYNDHPVAVFYDSDVGQWAIYNKDGASIPEGASFNVVAPQR